MYKRQTYSYLMEILRGEGYETVMIPGVPSFCAVAARLGVSLTEMNSPLHIVCLLYTSCWIFFCCCVLN